MTIVIEDLKLYELQLGGEHLEAAASFRRNAFIGFILDNGAHPINAATPDRRDNPELRRMRTYRVSDVRCE